MRPIAWVAALTWGTAAAAQSEARQVTTEFENAAVQVLRIRIAPHQKIPLHDVTPRVVVYLTDEHFRFDRPDGSSVEDTHKAGDVEWLPRQRHGGENLSDTSVEFVVVIPKHAR